jgi:hypothetical protein
VRASRSKNDIFAPLVSFEDNFEITTGCKLFEKANKEIILESVKSNPDNTAVATYQSKLKELYNALPDGERMEWEHKANNENNEKDMRDGNLDIFECVSINP